MSGPAAASAGCGCARRSTPRTCWRIRTTRAAEIFRTRTKDEWVETLNQAGVPCGPIYTLDQTFEDPQVKHLGIAHPIDHPTLGAIEVVGQPVNLPAVPEFAWRATPEHGEHTDEVLAELGYNADQIADLHQRAVV